jgi:hypothetical protein
MCSGPEHTQLGLELNYLPPGAAQCCSLACVQGPGLHLYTDEKKRLERDTEKERETERKRQRKRERQRERQRERKKEKRQKETEKKRKR